jgi:hypothetical protein
VTLRPAPPRDETAAPLVSVDGARARPMTVRPIFSAWRRQDALLLALSLSATILMALDFRIAPMRAGLDPSYTYAFSHAATHHARWGSDFLSTYGPFGCVIRTLDLGGLVWVRLASSLVLAAGFGVASWVYLRALPGASAGGRLAAMIAVVYASSVQGLEYRWFTFFLLVLLIGILADGRAGLAAHAVAGLLVGFFLLVKFSLGLSSAVTLGVGCCLARRPVVVARRMAVSALGLAAAFVSGWLASGGAISGIAGYLTMGFEMAREYSSAMSTHDGPWWIAIGAFLVWFALLALWGLMLRSPRTTLVLAGLAFPLFTAWKHSIVRQDMHVAILVRLGVFVVVLLVIEAVPVAGWRRALTAAGSLLVPLAIAWMTVPGISAVSPWNPLAFSGLTNLTALSELSAYRGRIEATSQAELRANVLPTSMRQAIGQSSVDVYPWMASYVPANGLAWAHRPLPASFNAYSPVLDGLNAAFFRSDRRPAFLIWHSDLEGGLSSIDGRHLFWDEPRTLLAIADHYEVVEAASGVVLLRARASPRFEAPQPLGTMQVSWGTRLPLPETDGIVLAAPALSRSLVLDLVTMGFRGQPVRLRVFYDSGAEAMFRLVTFNRDSGFWLSPLTPAFAELPQLLEGGRGRRVTAIAFEANALVRALLSSITVRWFRMVPRDAPHADSAVRPAPR